MEKPIKASQDERLAVTVGVRIPVSVRDTYMRQAQSEQRKLSEILRRVLIENANGKRAGRKG